VTIRYPFAPPTTIGNLSLKAMVYQPVLRQGRFESFDITASMVLDLDVIYHGTLRTVHQVQTAHVRRWRNSKHSEQARVEVLVKRCPVPYDSTN